MERKNCAVGSLERNEFVHRIKFMSNTGFQGVDSTVITFVEDFVWNGDFLSNKSCTVQSGPVHLRTAFLRHSVFLFIIFSIIIVNVIGVNPDMQWKDVQWAAK